MGVGAVGVVVGELGHVCCGDKSFGEVQINGHMFKKEIVCRCVLVSMVVMMMVL